MKESYNPSFEAARERTNPTNRTYIIMSLQYIHNALLSLSSGDMSKASADLRTACKHIEMCIDE